VLDALGHGAELEVLPELDHGAEITQYNGKTIITHHDKDDVADGNEDMAFAFIEADLVGFGSLTSVKASIDAHASGGGVNSDVPVTIQGKVESDSLRGDMNGGGPLLRLRSSGGGVRISANAQGQRSSGKGQR
jgi:hypothetical protein